jgi:hypothetical protein
MCCAVARFKLETRLLLVFKSRATSASKWVDFHGIRVAIAPNQHFARQKWELILHITESLAWERI